MSERDPFLQPPLDQCRACHRQITFASNMVSGKDGPLDYKSTIYVARRRDADQYGLKVKTIKQFLETVDHIRLKDGSHITPDELRFLSTHFESCPAAKRFSGKNRKGAPQ